ncbi:MAG: NAD(+)/NADH kinase [Muribaculaceae bacterium]|nr:NAD(+)/NADH kinase [Muribaculaceae bacterium]
MSDIRTTPPRHIAFYGSRRQDGHVGNIIALIKALLDRGIKISLERRLADVLIDEGFRPAVHGIDTCTAFPAEAELAVSVGGDGTFLRTAQWIDGRQVPIVGINTGHLGFLAENSTDDVDRFVELICSGEAEVERRMVLEVECDRLPSRPLYALNEVAFLKGAASMIDVSVKADGMFLANYRADGLLAATPTGSTAYNLSVGGPIVAPTLSCIILSPIAPHTLTLRPVVISGDSTIEVEVSSRATSFRLSVDGRSSDIPCGAVVKIRKASREVLTLRRPCENFATTLRTKLSWGT